MIHNYTNKELYDMSWNDKLQLIFQNKYSISSYKLKLQLIKQGYKEDRCENCKLDMWMGYKMPLELHHKNSNHLDNSLENLQILCSNCHSLTPTFCAGSKRKNRLNKTIPEYKEAIENSYNIKQVCEKLNLVPKGGNYTTIRSLCIKYGFKLKEPPIDETPKVEFIKNKPPYTTNKYKTKQEAYFSQCKVKNRPIKEDLLKLIWNNSLSKIGNSYGVSAGAIKKWCKKYNIPVPGVGYWAKYNANHIEECINIKQEQFNKYNIPII
jgi:5-methylcytosine-specific restriction endonuclease McrA